MGYMRTPSAVRLLVTVAAVAVVAVACADHAVPTAPHVASAPSADFSKVKVDSTLKVAICKLQKEDWKTQQIGRRGGKLDVGEVTLTVPAGALRRTVAITAHVLPTTSASVQFLPEGLHFAIPATLTMQYTKCDTPLLGVMVVYVQKDSVTEVELSNNHPRLKFVTAQIGHFSSYAVAY